MRNRPNPELVGSLVLCFYSDAIRISAAGRIEKNQEESGVEKKSRMFLSTGSHLTLPKAQNLDREIWIMGLDRILVWNSLFCGIHLFVSLVTTCGDFSLLLLLTHVSLQWLF